MCRSPDNQACCWGVLFLPIKMLAKRASLLSCQVCRAVVQRRRAWQTRQDSNEACQASRRTRRRAHQKSRNSAAMQQLLHSSCVLRRLQLRQHAAAAWAVNHCHAEHICTHHQHVLHPAIVDILAQHAPAENTQRKFEVGVVSDS